MTAFAPTIAEPASREALDWIARHTQAQGGRSLLVGGCVRDMCLGLAAKDLDVEVYGLDLETLERLLARRFGLNIVGRSFGVIKLQGLPLDISLPRRESRIGSGRRGFQVEHDAAIGFAEAAARRDFTINAIGLDPLSGELLDPYGGRADLEARTLRHTSLHFDEDPLRVLRGMQFVARFDLAATPETIAMCAGMTIDELPRERVFEEWKKLMLLGRRPSAGLRFLEACGWIRHFPELDALRGCEQDPEWHPEGDAWVHTLACLDAFAQQRTGDEYEDSVVGFAVLCHDLGKPATTRFERGRLRSNRHDVVGERVAETFLARLTGHRQLIDDILPLVRHHMSVLNLYNLKAGDAAIRRLAGRVRRIDRLIRVADADLAGCSAAATAAGGCPAGAWLLARARTLEVESSAPRAIVMGRDLIALGLSAPGPRLGKLLHRCYEAQINGAFDTLEGGIAYAKECLLKNRNTDSPPTADCQT